jgi:hypothetical protein
MAGYRGPTDALVRAAHPEFAFLPRVSALELYEPARGARRGFDAARGVHGLRRDQSGDAHFMLHFTDPALADFDLAATGLWDEALSASAEDRVVLSCIPDALVTGAARALVARGRAVTFKERCLTWEPRPGSVCAGGDPAALLAAAAAALPAGFALSELRADEARMVDAAWKYRKEGTTLRMVEECIATKPSVCIRDAAGAPVCWTVLRSDCSWGLLYTLPEQRRRGLSRAAMLAAFGRQRAWALGLEDAEQRALACAATPYVRAPARGGGGARAPRPAPLTAPLPPPLRPLSPPRRCTLPCGTRPALGSSARSTLCPPRLRLG